MLLPDKTLEELDGEVWGEPSYDSFTVTEAHRLRKVPLKELNIEEVAFLIRQKMEREYLIPHALELLETDPWLDGMYEGELLTALLNLDSAYWKNHPDQTSKMDGVVDVALDRVEDQDKIDTTILLLRMWKYPPSDPNYKRLTPRI